MFPAQTSFIPVTVALVKYIEANGFGGLYPFWYLGTTPTKYLIGPVVPSILIGLHKILPNLSLFDLSYFILITSSFIFSIGWGILAWKLSNQREIGVFVGIISLLLPWRFFSTMAFSEVSAVLASAMTPWVLLLFKHSLTAIKKRSTNLNSNLETAFPSRSGLRQHQMSKAGLLVSESWLRHVFDWRQAYASLAFSFLFLTNSTASIPAIVGILILGFCSNQKWGFAISRAFVVLLGGFILSSLLWYGIDYWLTIFSAPSIGGKSVLSAFVTLLNLLRSILPVLLAIVIVYFGFRPKKSYQKFAILWLTVFLSITLIRFMADPDFWMDWTSWASEVEVGLALVFAGPASRFLPASAHKTFVDVDIVKIFTVFKKKFLLRAVGSPSTTVTRNYLPQILLIIYLVIGWFFVWQKRDFWMPRRDISQAVEFRIAQVLNGLVKQDETVFLSGTTAFWLNSLVDVKQVRGGRDEVSTDGRWREATWEIREGATTEGTQRNLRALSIGYIVVHTDKSSEFYHDFKWPEKFENYRGFAKVYEKNGDVIYAIE